MTRDESPPTAPDGAATGDAESQAARPAGPEADLAAREAEYDRFVWDNLKRNYVGNYLHGMLGMTGFRLINAPTFMPVYIHLISGSNTVVGLAQALQQVGGIISPIFGATAIEHRKKVMPAALWMGGLGRVQIVGMALAGWFLQGQSLVYAMLALLFLFGVFMGAQRVVFGMLMAKVIPLSRRGRLQAWRNATGGLIAAVLAWVAGKYIIEPDMFGHGYSVTFALAAVLTTLGLWALQVLLREPEPPNLPAKARFRDRLRDFPALIRSDPGYAPFLLMQMLATASRMAVPFYAIYATSSTGLSGAILGLLALAYLGADTLSNLLWGYMGDRTGFRHVLLISLAMWILATVILLAFQTPAAIFIAFFGLGAAQSGYMMAAQTMILEFGNREEMPMRIAISSSAEGITASISPIVGGLVADALGYPAVFGISIGFLVLGLACLVFMVKEPRNRKLSGV